MSEKGKNAVRTKRLISIGAIWPELLEEIADLLDSKDSAPHVACFFQLPYPLHIDRAWHRVRGSREDKTLFLHFQARLARVQFDQFARLTVSELRPDDPLVGGVITQMIALIPLWEPRAKYYPEYARCVSDEDLVNRIIVPQQFSWIEHRAISAADYEFSLVARMARLILSGLRFFLPAYSISSLLEAPMSEPLSNFFTMPSPGRVIFNRPPEPILARLLSGLPDHPLNEVTSEKIQKALQSGLRELGKFEHQLFAMNRLRLQGEKALALIGTLSLLEWHLNLLFPNDSEQQEQKSASSKKQKQKQKSVSVLIEKGSLEFLPEGYNTLLSQASELRNSLVHGAPPSRHSLTTAHQSAGREQEYEGNIISSEMVEQVIRVALDVYRLSNLKRYGRL